MKTSKPLEKRRERGRGDVVLGPLALFDRRLDLFDDLFGDWAPRRLPKAMPAMFRERGFAPRMDLLETQKEFKVTAELPGLQEDDFEISLNRTTLTLRGQKQVEARSEEHEVHYTERAHGAFERTISLPAEVDADAVEASFKKGVLTVVLPKKTQEAVHKIEVKAD